MELIVQWYVQNFRMYVIDNAEVWIFEFRFLKVVFRALVRVIFFSKYFFFFFDKMHFTCILVVLSEF